jgi:hypothetical protein
MRKETTKSTMLVITTGFLILYLAFRWEWALVVSLVTGITGIISPFMSRKIEWAWMKLAGVLGYIVPNILLGLVFFLVLFPLSLLSKLFNKDPLMLSGKHGSMFVDVNKSADKSSFEKTW